MLSVSPSRYWFDVNVIFQSGNRNAGTSAMTATRIITRLLSVSGASKNAFALSSRFFTARPSVVSRSVAPSLGAEYCVIAIRLLIGLFGMESVSAMESIDHCQLSIGHCFAGKETRLPANQLAMVNSQLAMRPAVSPGLYAVAFTLFIPRLQLTATSLWPTLRRP